MAVVTAVSPVLPPSDTPEALSTKVVVVDVPRTAPAVVATASARRAPFDVRELTILVQHTGLGGYTNESSEYQKDLQIKMQTG